ncbi:MAG TPA: DedA family protein [Mycobacteriales bacterium]|jgi:membrane protein DedA with SNARE-associated domain|nr:DedA family protein [Mycobacteriales bacterium]
MIDTVVALVAHASSGAKPLPGVFGKLEPTLEHYGYLAVGGVLLLENIGLPLPGETILIAASLYAATGKLNIVLVAIIAIIASSAGSAIGYAIGVYGGRPLAERYGKYVFLTSERLDKTEEFFKRRGWAVVMLGRFVEGVRQAAGVIAGISDMNFWRFLTFTVLGATLWVATWTTVGEVAGDHVTTISHYATYVAEGIGVLIVLLVIRAVVRSRRKRETSTAA